MDSGNSGSLQSSSGGEDEFDSRAGGGGGGVDSSSPLSALLRPSPSPSAATFSLHGSYFGLQDFTSAPPPPHQQPSTWSSGSSFPGGASAGLPSSSSPRVAQPDSSARQQAADTAVAGQGAAMGGAPAPAPAAQQQPTMRGSRKRTRASRRAPTTVLTTDTSNFRAMVQEFTGIPSPPFGAGVGVGIGGPAGASSLRTRFDHIFPPPSSSLRSAAAADASLPPYLLRPFPHKLPTVPSSSFQPFGTTAASSSSSTLSSSNIGVANANATTGTAATAAGPSNSNPAAPAGAGGDTFQQLTSSALLRLQQDPSSYLSFQNLLDSQQPSSQSIFGAAAGGFGHGQASSSRLHDPAPSPSDFLASVGGSGSLTHHGGFLGSEGLHLHHHSRSGDELSGVVAAGASGGGSCKLNYSSHAGAGTSSSGAGASADRPPDGGGGGAGGAAAGRPGRGEGQLDPWICTSE